MINQFTLYNSIPHKYRTIYKRILLKFGDCKSEFWSITLRKFYKEALDIQIGTGSYGCFDETRFPCGTIIGNYCSFASGSCFLSRNHPMNYASTHPMFFNETLGYIDKATLPFEKLTVGSDVWIGRNVLICNKCTSIGTGSVIAAGSVVTRNVPPYAIVGGAPARLIRMRFPDNTIQDLLDSRWYELSPEDLRKCADVVNDPAKFIERVCTIRRIKIE